MPTHFASQSVSARIWVDDRLQVRVDRIAVADLVEIAREHFDVTRLVHHLDGRGELAVEVRHDVDELPAHHQRGLLAVEHLREREGRGFAEEPALHVVGQLRDAREARQEVLPAIEHVLARLVGGPVDVQLGVPLVALRLRVQRLELLGVERVVIAEHALHQRIGVEAGGIGHRAGSSGRREARAYRAFRSPGRTRRGRGRGAPRSRRPRRRGSRAAAGGAASGISTRRAPGIPRDELVRRREEAGVAAADQHRRRDTDLAEPVEERRLVEHRRAERAVGDGIERAEVRIAPRGPVRVAPLGLEPAVGVGSIGVRIRRARAHHLGDPQRARLDRDATRELDQPARQSVGAARGRVHQDQRGDPVRSARAQRAARPCRPSNGRAGRTPRSRSRRGTRRRSSAMRVERVARGIARVGAVAVTAQIQRRRSGRASRALRSATGSRGASR